MVKLERVWFEGKSFFAIEVGEGGLTHVHDSKAVEVPWFNRGWVHSSLPNREFATLRGAGSV